jgi:hypothetical protein
VTAAVFAGRYLEYSARESGGGPHAAEMGEGGNILLLLPVCRHVRAGERPISVALLQSSRQRALKIAAQHFFC